ncbi:MAG: GMC family oxidoreductase [Deltaproteobacteria bacterium]|nr:GMC family oxidoreductase [Deltaproteobacteria bacterium]
MKREADVIVVGSGAGGATIARELSRRGFDVLILEKGRYHKHFLGTHLGAALMSDQMGLRVSREGVQCVRAITTGGSTMFTCGTYSKPAPFIAEKLGIDLSEFIDETRTDMGVGKMPQKFIEGSSLMLLEAALKCGYKWEVFEKFINPDKCREHCSDCMMGCPHDAKWTARNFVDQAVSNGATLYQSIRVESVLHSNGKVTGVQCLKGTELIKFYAPLVILAAGGMASAPILNRSGIWAAGQGVFLDPLMLVGGAYQGSQAFAGSKYNPPMTVGSWEFYESEGFMLAPLVDPWMMFIAQMGMVSIPRVFKFLRYPRWMSIMTKITDDRSGQIYLNENFTKPLTDADRHKLDRGAEVSTEILIKAGCKPKSIVRGPIRGAHPGGTCPIGTVVDKNLETEIGNLYVSDASVFPEALGTPVVATVVAMNKRLTKHLVNKKAAN